LVWSWDIIPNHFDDHIRNLDIATISIDETLAYENVLSVIQEKEIISIPYSVNDHSRAAALQAHGVRHFISDVPDVIEDGILTMH